MTDENLPSFLVDATEKSLSALPVGVTEKSLQAFPPFIALVPEDLEDSMDEAGFIDLMESMHGCHIIEIIKTGVDYAVAMENIKRAARLYEESSYENAVGQYGELIGQYGELIGKSDGNGNAIGGRSRHLNGRDTKPGIILLQEAWQPPIKETLSFIKNVRGCVGKKTPLMVALVGKPRPGTIFTPVGEIDWTIWQAKLATVSDPWLYMEKIVAK